MPSEKFKKLISITLAFSIVLSMPTPTQAVNDLALPPGNQQLNLPAVNQYIAQKSSSEFSFKNIDRKMSKILKSNNNREVKSDLISFNNGHLNIISCEVMSPDVLEGYGYKKEDIKKITIVTCKKIEDSTFSGCTNLEEVTITTCNLIGENAFYNNENLEKLTIVTCKSIGAGAFSNCANLKSVSIITVGELGKSAFSDCTNLEKVKLTSCDFLGESAFSGCASLSDFEFTGGIVEPEHGEEVFNGCDSLTRVKVPSNYETDSFCGKAVDKSGPEYTGGSTSQTTSNSNNSKTAIIAGTVSAAAAVIIAVAVTLTCYFKKLACFGRPTDRSASEV